MGKCHSKKKSIKEIAPPIQNQDASLINFKHIPLKIEEKHSDFAQSIDKELQQQMTYDEDNPLNDNPHDLPEYDSKPKSEPFILLSSPNRKHKSTVFSENTLQCSNFLDPTSNQIPENIKKNSFLFSNNSKEFFDSNIFFTASKENLGFETMATEKMEHIPTLKAAKTIKLLECQYKNRIFEKWLCCYDLDDSGQPRQAFLNLYKEDFHDMRKELFIKLKGHEIPQISSIYEVFLSESLDFHWNKLKTETIICEVSRSNLRCLIEKRGVMKIFYTEEEILYFIDRALRGLLAAKDLKIAHLSLTTDCFHYTEDYKISGFGEIFLQQLPEKTLQRICFMEFDKKNIRFLAPELMSLVLESEKQEKMIDPFKCDLFSLGIVVLDMLNLNQTPIEYCKESYLPKLLDSLTKKYSSVVHLLRNMLNYKASERYDVETLLKIFEQNEKNFIDESKLLNKLKKINPNYNKKVNELIYIKDYLNKEETYENITEFLNKGLIFFNLQSFDLSIEFISICLKFENFSTIMLDDEIFQIYFTLGICHLKLDLYKDAVKYFQKADSCLKGTRIENKSREDIIEEPLFFEKTLSLFEKSTFNQKYITLTSSTNPNKKKTSLILDEPKEELLNSKLISVLYYKAYCSYKMKDFDASKSFLNEIWNILNFKIIVKSDFLCEYFELCGLLYNFLGKYKLSSKYFQIYEEKANQYQKQRVLFHQAKLELAAGNYIESCDYFTQLLLFYDSKEYNQNISNSELLETFGYLLQISELIKDSKEFFYILDRIQTLWSERTTENYQNSYKWISDVLDWILRFGAYFQFFSDEKLYFVKIMLFRVKEALENYPLKDFAIYSFYNLGKGFYYAGSHNDSLECFSEAWQLIKLFLLKKYIFQTELTAYCCIDTVICLAILSKEKEYQENLSNYCDKIIANINPNKGFLIYYNTMKIKIIDGFKEDYGEFEQNLIEIERSLFLDLENDPYLKYFRSFSLFYETKLLLLLQEQKTQQAKEMIETLMKAWLLFDKTNILERPGVLMDDYSQLKQISIEESYQFFCEVSWFYEKIAFKFIKFGYLHNAKILLLKIRESYFRKGLIETNLFTKSPNEYHFTLPNGEHYIDLYNLLSMICYQLDERNEGFEYLIKAYELLEKLWISELQPFRLEKKLINLSFSMSQSFHMQGNYENAFKILESKRVIFETKSWEIQHFYKTNVILLKIKNLQFQEAQENIDVLLKFYNVKYDRLKEFDLLIKILKLEIFLIEIKFEKGDLEGGEKDLLNLMRRINQIYQNNKIEKKILDDDLEFRSNFQKVIARYYTFIMNFDKSLFHLKKANMIAKIHYGKFSIFSLEFNNLIVENLISQDKILEALEIFQEFNQEKKIDLCGLAFVIRKKIKAKLCICSKKPEEALEELELCIQLLGERSLQYMIGNLILKKENIINDEKKITTKNTLFILLAEILLLKGKALISLDKKEEGEITLIKAFEVFEIRLQEIEKLRHPLIIEIILEIIAQRMKRFKIVEYFQIIKSLVGFLPEEKTLFIELLNENKTEIQMIKIFEKFGKNRDEDSLAEALRIILKQKYSNEEKKKISERKKYKNFLMNKKLEIDKTKEMIQKAYIMALGLYKNYKENKFLLESIKYYKMLNDI